MQKKTPPLRNISLKETILDSWTSNNHYLFWLLNRSWSTLDTSWNFQIFVPMMDRILIMYLLLSHIWYGCYCRRHNHDSQNVTCVTMKHLLWKIYQEEIEDYWLNLCHCLVIDSSIILNWLHTKYSKISYTYTMSNYVRSTNSWYCICISI